ncbi:MAG: glycosyl transferase, partial [Bacteroidetes bacterium 4572_117]
MIKNRKQKFLNHFNKLASDYTKYKRRFGYYWRDIVAYLNYFLTNDQSILDVGCGTGDTLSKLKGGKKVGIDISPDMINQAKKQHPDIEFRLMDADNLRIDEKFDVIIISNVIGYLENIQDVLLSLKKVCKPQTRIIITYYNVLWEPFLHVAEWIGLKKKSPRQNWLSVRDVKNLLYLSGFDSYRVSRRTLIPFNIPIISFVFNKIIGRLPFFNILSLNYFVFARPNIKP